MSSEKNGIITLGATPISLGRGSTVYTYQSTGAGTSNVLGSNDGVNWTTIVTLSNTDSAVLVHSWLYLKCDGPLSIKVSRG